MKNILHCAALSALTVLALSLAWLANDTRLVVGQVAATISKIAATVDGTRADLQALESGLLKETGTGITVADRRLMALGETVTVVSSQVTAHVNGLLDRVGVGIEAAGEAVTELAKLRRDLGPILADVGKITANASHTSGQIRDGADLLLDCEGNPQCFPNRIIGTDIAVERAAQAIERTARAVSDGVPPILAVALKVGENSDKTAAETAGLMENLRLSTRPLPSWMRVGLQVMVPAAQGAAAAATSYSVLH